MPNPQREGARFRSDRALLVEHDDILFGGWNEAKAPAQPKRARGVLERLGTVEMMLKYLGAAVLFLVLHAAGVPTEDIGRAAVALLGLH